MRSSAAECVYSVSQKNPPGFSDIFPNGWEFYPKFYTPITRSYTLDYKYLFNYGTPTVTKLCHIKCDHPACVSADGRHFEHYGVNWVVTLNMA